MPKRNFFPPAACDACGKRPAVGHVLWHSGSVWLCPQCLTQQADGESITSKATKHSLEADLSKSLSKRARAAGEVEQAAGYENRANWHAQASSSIKDGGQRQLQSVDTLHGEVAPASDSWLKDTLLDPDLAAIDASHMRGKLLEANNVTALALDTSKTVQANNSAEKLISHQMALSHKIGFEQAAMALNETDPNIEMKRLQVVSRMMKSTQEAVLALQKLKSGGPQSVTVQHVHIESGGQALVGNVKK